MELNEALDRSLRAGKEEEVRKIGTAIIICAEEAKDCRWFPELQKTGVLAREVLTLLDERDKTRVLERL